MIEIYNEGITHDRMKQSGRNQISKENHSGFMTRNNEKLTVGSVYYISDVEVVMMPHSLRISHNASSKCKSKTISRRVSKPAIGAVNHENEFVE